MFFRPTSLLLGCWAVASAQSNPAVVDVRAEFAKAQALTQSQQIAEARAAYERVIVLEPTHPEANSVLAIFACNAGDWQTALRCAGHAIAGDAHNARYQYAWGAANGIAALKTGVFSRLVHAKKCLAAYRRAVELEPDSLQYRWALLNYYQQAPGFAGGNIARAYEQAEAIKRLDPARGRDAVVQIHVHEKKYDLAFAEVDAVLRQTPDDYLALYQLGRLSLVADRRLEDGLAAFRRCLELIPPSGSDAPSHAHVHWRLGNHWEKKHQPGQARAEYATALQLDPGFQPAKRALEKLPAAQPE